MKRLLSMILIIAICMTLLPGSIIVSASGLKGAGTEEDPYLIYDAEDLIAFRDLVNDGAYSACARLENDIVLNAGTFSVDGSFNPLYNGEAIDDDTDVVEWIPIGKPSSTATNSDTNGWYLGTFDGNGKTISGLYCNNQTEVVVATMSAGGLFGAVGAYATIQNLGVVNSYIRGVGVGAIAAGSVGTIIGCYSDAYLYAAPAASAMFKIACIGGTVGATLDVKINGVTYAGSISDCHYAGQMKGASSTYCGGIVGLRGVTDTLYPSNAVLTNNYYLDQSAINRSYDGAEAMDAEQFASGEAAYKLNNGVTDGTAPFRQTIGTDAYPVFTGKIVYGEVAYHNRSLVKVEAKAATCTTAGNKEHYACSVCGWMTLNADGTTQADADDIVIAAKGHSIVPVAAKNATCTSGGNVAYYTCKTCGEIFQNAAGTEKTTLSAVTLAAKGHSMTKTEAKAATCTTAGNKTYYHCSACGYYYLDANGTILTTLGDVTISAKGHNMTKTAAKSATCTEAGNREYYTCSTCGKIYLNEAGTSETTLSAVVIAATGHSMTRTGAAAATCTASGNREYYTCGICGNVYLDQAGQQQTTLTDVMLAAKGHSMTRTAGQDATCTKAGNLEYYTCSGCGKVFLDPEGVNETTLSQIVIAATGHSMSKTPAKAANCTSGGNVAYYTCSDCGNLYLDEAGLTLTTLDGVKTSAKGHSMKRIDAKEPTATEAGNCAYYLCTGCGKLFYDQYGNEETTLAEVTIPATGVVERHELEFVEAQDATCTESGNTAHYRCTDCGKRFLDSNAQAEVSEADVTTAAKGHDPMKVEAKTATCTSDGNLEYYICGTCEKVFEDQACSKETTLDQMKIAARGHDTTMTAKQDATCTADGNLEYYTCNRCGNLYLDRAGNIPTTEADVIIRAQGHDMTMTAQKSVTCTESGNDTYYTCKTCHDIFRDMDGQEKTTLQDVTIQPTGHSMVKTDAVEATCTSGGNKEYHTCNSCGNLYLDQAGNIPATETDVLLSAKGHDMAVTGAKNATCTESGNRAFYTCDRCDKIFADANGQQETTVEAMTIQPKGHRMTLVEAAAATCTADGNMSHYKCAACENLYWDEMGQNEASEQEVVINAHGHAMTLVAEFAASCTEPGMRAYYSCGNCGKKYLDEAGTKETMLEEVTLSATGHSMTRVPQKNATAKEAGNWEYYVCTNCGKLYWDEAGENETTAEAVVIPETGEDPAGTEHIMVRVPQKPAGCTQAGNVEYYNCMHCSQMFLDEEGKQGVTTKDVTIDALGHDIKRVAAKSATETEAGNIQYYLCNRCGKLYLDRSANQETTLQAVTIPATGSAEKPDPTEPETTAPGASEPDLTEPSGAETEPTTPGTSDPDTTEPDATKPDATDPDATEPDATEPDETKPGSTEPNETQPGASDPTEDTGNQDIPSVTIPTVPADPDAPEAPSLNGTEEVEVPDPVISGPVLGSKVDGTYLYLDVDPLHGMDLKTLAGNMSLPGIGSYQPSVSIKGNQGDGKLKTADRLKITLKDSLGNVVGSKTLILVILGDVNCDGMVLSNDAVVMMRIYTGAVEASEEVLLAGDLDQNGSIGANDARRAIFKYYNWGGSYQTTLQ